MGAENKNLSSRLQAEERYFSRNEGAFDPTGSREIDTGERAAPGHRPEDSIRIGQQVKPEVQDEILGVGKEELLRVFDRVDTTRVGEGVEADPDGIGAHAPGAKLDRGKPDMSLLADFSRALYAVAEVATFGANKYSRGGWLKVNEGFRRYTSALLRHIFPSRPSDYDPDSNLLHDAHAAWNALARLELRIRQKEKYDEYKQKYTNNG